MIMAQNGLLSNKWLLLATIGIELASAVLIFTLRDRLAWWLIVGLFSVFLIAASYSIISGAECNCFGFDWLGTWFTLPVDLCVLALAFVTRSQAGSLNKGNLQLPRILAISTILALTGVAFAEIRKTATFSAKKLEYLVADDMLGNPWPITDAYHPALSELKSGKWLVLILRPDCDHCRTLIEEHFKNPRWHRPGERTAVFLAGSLEWSFSVDYVTLEPGDNRIKWDGREPFVASPLVLLISDGIVNSSADFLSLQSYD
jgi:hypothetical protein